MSQLLNQKKVVAKKKGDTKPTPIPEPEKVHPFVAKWRELKEKFNG